MASRPKLAVALAAAWLFAAALATTLHSGCRAGDPAAVERSARGQWLETAQRLDALIAREIEQKQIPALAIALVDGDEVAWAKGFGQENAETGAPADLATVWRAGSVSKMFTDLAVMKLVERGRLDLDAPVTTWLPEFAPENPFRTPITLRQLMAHRAGLVREPPVGHYFDPTEPTLAATVASLNGTTLVYAPATRTKYSNAGIAVVGRVVEVVTGKPFAQAVHDEVLAPMGLAQSSFEQTPAVKARLAQAQMWTYFETSFAAPTFELGMAPAGSLYATVTDLAQAMVVFLAEGRGPEGTPEEFVVRPESLAEMWKPQFADPGAKSGFGLGFHVDEFAGTRRVGHDGAIYGFSTILALLPELELGVVLLASKDVAHGAMARIAEDALSCMARARRGEPLGPPMPQHGEVGAARARALAGRYRSADGGSRLDLLEQKGELWLARGATRGRLRTSGEWLVADDLVVAGPRLRPVSRSAEGLSNGKAAVAIEMDGVVFERVATPRPPPPPDWAAGLIGEYGWDHNVLYVLEEDGELHALIEWFFDYPLTRESDDLFAFPDKGLYFGEKLTFVRGRGGDGTQGDATAAFVGPVKFPRLAVGTREGVTFRIEPTRPIAELRAAALAATPPSESGKRPPELVDLAPIDPTLRFDLRYATTDNFMGAVFYEQARAFLQQPAALALQRVQRSLASEGFGLLVHDAYRPWFVTKMFWDGTPLEHHEMVADPSKGSRHNRGCAIDLTLCDLATGRPARMPSGYDEFSDRANPWYPGGTSEQRWLRDRLRAAMESEGFTVYEHEWWHYDFGAWRDYPVLNVTFEAIGRP